MGRNKKDAQKGVYRLDVDRPRRGSRRKAPDLEPPDPRDEHSSRRAIVDPVIADDLTPYCLRHDYCTRLAKAGVDIRTAQKLMGHSTIQLTANVYTHVDEDQILEAGRLINE